MAKYMKGLFVQSRQLRIYQQVDEKIYRGKGLFISERGGISMGFFAAPNKKGKAPENPAHCRHPIFAEMGSTKTDPKSTPRAGRPMG